METLSREKTLLAIALIIATGAAIFAAYRYTALAQENAALEGRVAELNLSNDRIALELSKFQNDNADLNHSLAAAENQNAGFATAIGDLTNTVGQLQKLSEMDPQLLKKYSKVYFLDENYAPASLSSIDAKFLYNTSHPQLLLSGVVPFLNSMINAAVQDGVTLQVVSAYRSFFEQSYLKTEYKVTYGTGANQFSADQGYSEHQLGTAIDFGAPGLANVFTQFASSSAYQWLQDNAYKYGFVISYPKQNTYYEFEPWHWRFVGRALAQKIHDDNEYFYNLTQRDIDAYLASFYE